MQLILNGNHWICGTLILNTLGNFLTLRIAVKDKTDPALQNSLSFYLLTLALKSAGGDLLGGFFLYTVMCFSVAQDVRSCSI